MFCVMSQSQALVFPVDETSEAISFCATWTPSSNLSYVGTQHHGICKQIISVHHLFGVGQERKNFSK